MTHEQTVAMQMFAELNWQLLSLRVELARERERAEKAEAALWKDAAPNVEKFPDKKAAP